MLKEVENIISIVYLCVYMCVFFRVLGEVIKNEVLSYRCLELFNGLYNFGFLELDFFLIRILRIKWFFFLESI